MYHHHHNNNNNNNYNNNNYNHHLMKNVRTGALELNHAVSLPLAP